MLMMCPICAGGFEVALPECPACGCNLVPSSFDRGHGEPVSSGPRKEVSFVELCRPRVYPLAVLIKQMLEQNGVAVLIKGLHSLSVQPHLAFGGELRVLVDKDQLEYARAIYHAYFEGDHSAELAEE